MKKPELRYLFQAVGCLMSSVISWTQSFDLLSQEFGGGSATGPVTKLNIAGSFLSGVACALTFFRPRLSAIVGLLGSLLCLPLYLYFVTPGLFRQVLPGNYSVPLQDIAPGSWAIAGTVVAAVTIFLSLWNLRRVSPKE